MIDRLIRAAAYWKESTVFLPIVVLIVLLIGCVIILLTGRQLMVDIGGLLDTGVTLIRIALACSLVGFFQKSLFGYRTESGGDGKSKNKPPLADDIYDAAVSFGLLILFLSIIFYFG